MPKNKLYRTNEGKVILRHWAEQRSCWDYYIKSNGSGMLDWYRAGNQVRCEFDCNYRSKLIGVNLTNTGL